MAQRYGPETTVLDWSKRLVCSVCGSDQTDMVVPGTERRQHLAGSYATFTRKIFYIKGGVSGEVKMRISLITAAAVVLASSVAVGQQQPTIQVSVPNISRTGYSRSVE